MPNMDARRSPCCFGQVEKREEKEERNLDEEHLEHWEPGNLKDYWKGEKKKRGKKWYLLVDVKVNK